MNRPGTLPVPPRAPDPADAARLRAGNGDPPGEPPREHGDDGRGEGDDPSGIEVFAMKWFIASEAMMFVALIAVHLATALQQDDWPPPDQPRLPVWTTVANTLVLLFSGRVMLGAERALERGALARGGKLLVSTFALGCLFLLVQGVEWARMLGHGLTVTSSLYGSLFYIVIGVHAAHVAIAVGFLGWVARRALGGRYGPGRMTGVRLCRIFWLFVVWVWPTLFIAVYLI